MSSDSPSGSTQVVQNNDPWRGQQPYLEKGFQAAQQNILDTPLSYYPNSTVVPFSQQTEQALQGIEQRATQGSPVTQAAQSNLTGTLQGDYLNAGSNPYLGSAIDAAIRPTVQNYQDTILPGIQQGFEGSGRYGSGLQAYQQRKAGSDLTRNIGDIAGSMAYQNYGNERTNQLRAAAFSPDLAQTDYTDLQALQQTGAAREQQAGAQLQDQINRFMFQQQEPRDRAREYMTLVGGGSYGGTSTTQKPIYSNDFATGLGYAGTAAGIAGSLFGGGQNSAYNGLLGLF